MAFFLPEVLISLINSNLFDENIFLAIFVGKFTTKELTYFFDIMDEEEEGKRQCGCMHKAKRRR